MGKLCDHLAEGGTLATFCRRLDVRYRIILAWVEADTERAELYQQSLDARKGVLSDEVLDGVVSIVRQDLRTAYDEKGRARSVQEIPDALAGNLTSLKTESLVHTDAKTGEKSVETVVSEVKSISRQTGLEMLGKMTGALGADKLELTGANGGPILMGNIQANIGKLSTAELKALFGLLQKLSGPPPLDGGKPTAKVLKLPALKAAKA